MMVRSRGGQNVWGKTAWEKRGDFRFFAVILSQKKKIINR